MLILTPGVGLAGDGTFGVPPSGVLAPPAPPPLRLAPAAPAKTAALVPPDRAAPETVIAPRRVQQTYQPAPAEGAGRSRALPPSEAPVHSPVIAPPKNKRFKAPTASVDPEYAESVAQGAPRSLSVPAEPAPVVAQGAAPEQKRGLFNMLRGRQQAQPQVVQAPVAPMPLTPAAYTAPAYAVPSNSAASAAYAEYNAAPVQQPAAVAAPQAPVPPVAAPVQMQQAAAPAPAKSRLSSLFSFGGGGTSKAKPGARANDGTPCSEKRGLFTSPPECR